MKPIQNTNLLPSVPAPVPADNWTDLKAYVLQELSEKLPPDLFYHGIHHTRDDVLPAAARLAELARLDPASRLILVTAALCHDVGFMIAYQDHEQNAVGLVHAYLPRFGYSSHQVADVIRLILATTMPQRPTDVLEALLCDADLDSLGREDYLKTSMNLWRELAIYGQQPGLADWYRRQYRFLTGHSYFTQEARALRDAGKAENICLLERLLRGLDVPDAP